MLAVQILRDRVKIRGLAVDGDLAAFTLPEQPHAAFDGLFRDLNGLIGREFPAGGAGAHDVDEARAVLRRGLCDLALEVLDVADRCGGLIYQRRVQKHKVDILADFLLAGWRSFGGCTKGGRTGTLSAGVHICLVVAADINCLVTALDRAGQCLEADIKGAAIAGVTHDVDVVLALDLQRLGHAGCKSGQAHQNGLHAGDAPAGLVAVAGDDRRAARRRHGDGFGAEHLQSGSRDELHRAALAGSHSLAYEIKFRHCTLPPLP